jgi:CRP-like cAMP-binding protein
VFHKRTRSVDGTAKLRGVSFFEGFSEEDLDRVAELADDVEAEAGAVLVEQGRVGQECFVILDGRASVYVGDDKVDSLGPGSMVGEMALIDHLPRVATVVADEPMTLVAFDTRRFRTLLDEIPKAGERVLQVLAERRQAKESW